MDAIHILLQDSIDYAGLFPPAGLDMPAAVANYARYVSGPDSWALGRFVLPIERIGEFEAAARPYLSIESGHAPWQLSALVGANLQADLAAVARFNSGSSAESVPPVLIDSLELKASSSSAAEDSTHILPPHLQAYIEIPIGGDPSGLIRPIARAGRRAKVRTGGITADAFPTSSDLIRFMAVCLRAGVPFKATAGLHHPVRAEYNLTYAADSPRGLMFGFLNLFLAAAFLQAGLDEEIAERLLEERSLEAFQINEQSAQWREHRLTLGDLRRARRQGLVSFGSCSFTEPLEALQALGLLDSRVSPA
jgi:hypothetical protein